LFDRVEGEIIPLQVTGHDGIRFECRAVDPHILTLFLILKAQRDLAIRFQRHEELALQAVLDEPHIFSRRIPHSVEHIAKRNPVVHRLAQQSPADFVFCDRRGRFSWPVFRSVYPTVFSTR